MIFPIDSSYFSKMIEQFCKEKYSPGLYESDIFGGSMEFSKDLPQKFRMCHWYLY